MPTKTKQSKTKNIPKLRFPGFSGEWKMDNLGSMVDVVGGGTPETNKMEYWNGDINWFTPTEIKQKYVRESVRKISDIGLQNSSAKLLPINSLLFTSRATIGDVSIATEECTTNQGFQSMIVNDRNSVDFFYYWILKNKKEFLRRANGSTFLEISGKEIKRLKGFFPKSAERQKIGNFLTLIDDYIDNLKKQKELFENHKKGIMQKIFSQEIRFKGYDGKDFPKWEVKKLEDVANLKNGYAFESNKYTDYGEYRIITIKNVQNGGLDVEKINKLEKLPNDIQEHQILNRGDLLVSMTGNVGRICRVDFDNCLLNQRVGKIVVNQFINISFLYQLLNRKYFEYRMKSLAQGGAQGNISKYDIMKFEFLLPAIEEQQKITNFLSLIDGFINSKKEEIVKIGKWKGRLIQKLFV